jgi:phosphohistidine phosphatase
MMLYLIQHGEALDKSLDPDRPLTEDGRAAVIHVARFAKHAGVSVTTVWHSGKSRAAQTAEIIAAHWTPGISPAEHDGLNPKDNPDALVRELQAHESDLAVVGHLPHLSRVVSLLLLGDRSREIVAFQRGGVVALERDATGEWRINWIVAPNLALP